MKNGVSSLMLRAEKAHEERIGKVCSVLSQYSDLSPVLILAISALILSDISAFHAGREVRNHA